MSSLSEVLRTHHTLPNAVVWACGTAQVWADLERSKGVIVEEPEAAADFKAAKRRYEDAVDGGPGGRGGGGGGAGGSAILLAVYRGKMSEVRARDLVPPRLLLLLLLSP